MPDAVSSGNILTTLLLCGLMGLLGQGVRAAIGLKGASGCHLLKPTSRPHSALHILC